MTHLPKTPGITPWEQRMQFSLEEDDYRVVFQTDAVVLDHLFEHFIQFLQSAGYRYESIYETICELALEHDASQDADTDTKKDGFGVK